MTYLESIKEDLRPFPVTSNMIVRQCEKHGLTSSDVNTDEQTVKLCEIELVSQMLVMSSVSEGGVSKSFNVDGAKRFLISLCKQAGVDASTYTDKPKLTFYQ